MTDTDMTEAPLGNPGDDLPAIELEDLTPELVAYFADDPCLIWSGEHSAYWRTDGHGYTTDREQAGVYTLHDAYFVRTCHCGPEKRIAFVRPTPASGVSMAGEQLAENAKCSAMVERVGHAIEATCDCSGDDKNGQYFAFYEDKRDAVATAALALIGEG